MDPPTLNGACYHEKTPTDTLQLFGGDLAVAEADPVVAGAGAAVRLAGGGVAQWWVGDF